jgi:hypothetical protein
MIVKGNAEKGAQMADREKAGAYVMCTFSLTGCVNRHVNH